MSIQIAKEQIIKDLTEYLQDAVNRICVCPGPCGGNVFFKTGKMYCSVRCAKIVTQANWRKNPINRRKEAQLAKQRRARAKEQSK